MKAVLVVGFELCFHRQEDLASEEVIQAKLGFLV